MKVFFGLELDGQPVQICYASAVAKWSIDIGKMRDNWDSEHHLMFVPLPIATSIHSVSYISSHFYSTRCEYLDS